MIKTPDELLAEQIVEELRNEKLIDTTKLDTLKDDLAKGQVTSEAWRLRCELADRGKEKVNG